MQVLHRPSRQQLHPALCVIWLSPLEICQTDLALQYSSLQPKDKPNHAIGGLEYVYSDGPPGLTDVPLLILLEWRSNPRQLADSQHRALPKTPILKVARRKSFIAIVFRDCFNHYTNTFSFTHTSQSTPLPTTSVRQTFFCVPWSLHPQHFLQFYPFNGLELPWALPFVLSPALY